MSSDEARAESIRRVNLRQRGAFDGLDMVSHGAAMAAWQAERDAERITELEAEVERLRAPGRIAEAVAQVTPCSCSAQRARAEAAESRLAAVREIVATPPSMLGQPVARWIDRLLTRLRAALDGDAEVTTIPTTLAKIDAGPTFVCSFEDECKTGWELLEEVEARLARVPGLLGVAWDQGNACGLDGWVGPGRGAGEVDDEAVRSRDRVVSKLLAVLDGEETSRG